MEKCSPGYLLDMGFKRKSGVKENAKVADEWGRSDGGGVKIETEVLSGFGDVFWAVTAFTKNSTFINKTVTYHGTLQLYGAGVFGMGTPPGHVWLCGKRTYLYLGPNWCGTCTLAKLAPSSFVFPESDLTKAQGRNLKKNQLARRDFTPVQRFVPFSDNGGRKPLIGDAKGVLFTLIPSLGVSFLSQRVTEIWWTLENITSILDDVVTQLANDPETKALTAMTMQNRLGLDLLFAQQGGLCAAVGIDHCCTFIPDSSKNWTEIHEKVENLRQFLASQEDNTPQLTWLSWLMSGTWTQILAKISIMLVAVLIAFCIFAMCIIPCLRQIMNKMMQSMIGAPGQYMLIPFKDEPDPLTAEFDKELEANKWY